MNDDRDLHGLPADVWAEMSATERLTYLVASQEPVPPEVTRAALDVFPQQQESSGTAGDDYGDHMSSDLSDWCDAVTELTSEEMAQLDALPDGHHLLEAERGCEIREYGHDGPHMALGQASGDDEWWLLWDSATKREMRVLPPCEVEDVDLGEVCVLPLDHRGHHSFKR